MTSASAWRAILGAGAVAYALASLRTQVELGNPLHAIAFSVVLLAGFAFVLEGISPPSLQVRLLRWRLSPLGRAVEWAGVVGALLLAWSVLGRRLLTAAVAVVVVVWWFRRDEYYDALREEMEELTERDGVPNPNES